MSNPYQGVMFRVKATVLDGGAGGCRVGHRSGQTWLMQGVPPGICSFAFNAMFPAYWTLRFGGSDPAEENPDQMHVTCSGMGCGARFLIERISDEEADRLQAEAELISLDHLARSIPVGLSRRIR
ncbi:MAG: TIGR04076 family protein [Ardenticatenaceae bacterium]|nr:TIGR04076 family protein [Ardenticatenaceae bacterium]